ncbi:prokaryotic ubiquitin-like protein Pup [Saccharopolyspora subtropica]|uniref:Prokaryotic ubiquitin-like protein Pup n=1 Tax=Saccharopolyspora thermophila TaxID=89367 RepID=A0A917NDC4_9PSEU|nr:ubiquitin-like protein Pup [Saccharopolyspora subtropica]GGI89376.1 prokaryotic ubiquitin-like protein Pup [Saccharopolyspora subtropica]
MRQEKNRPRPRDDDDDATEPTPTGQQRRDKLTDDTEATLDEIDDILEENAEDFVRSYIQKGGE